MKRGMNASELPKMNIMIGGFLKPSESAETPAPKSMRIPITGKNLTRKLIAFVTSRDARMASASVY